MSYVYERAAELAGEPLEGDGACVALVKAYTNVGATSGWRPEKTVKGDSTIRPGTVIATFENERYPNRSYGNRAAFYLSQDSKGIYVVEQWRSLTKVQKRHIRFQARTKTVAISTRATTPMRSRW
ncbi:BPSL0067 family protein [Burkholderia latens]|uniref:BPSL0067 family protein n=1 Tax=Burkholderia latens TaxID=488446 RepID=UPI001FC84168|nr:BPSL0067 family protein [Burkholderia latens]